MIQALKSHTSLKLEEKKLVLKWHLDTNTVSMLMQPVVILDFIIFFWGVFGPVLSLYENSFET